MSDNDSQPQTQAEYFEQRREERKRKQQARQRDFAQQTRSEMIGKPDYDADETKTCGDCGDTTPARKWGSEGPTHSDNGVSVQICTLERCPNCGTAQ